MSGRFYVTEDQPNRGLYQQQGASVVWREFQMHDRFTGSAVTVRVEAFREIIDDAVHAVLDAVARAES